MKRLLLNAAAFCLAVAVLAALRWTTPGYAVLTGAVPSDGRPGVTTAARGFTIRIGSIELGKSLRYRAFGKVVERSSDGVFAVAHATVAATVQSTSLGGITWEDANGVSFAHSRRVDGAGALLLGKRLQPGLPQEGIFVFELPRGELDGARILVSETIDPRLDSQARILLPTDLDGRPVSDRLDLDEGASVH
jgi:hypothetical protein